MKARKLHVILIIALSALAYLNTFWNPFVFDDQFFIVDNTEIRSLRNIPQFFAGPSTGNLYRPLRGVLYAFTYSIWELNPFGYHLNAVLLSIGISILAYLIASQLFKNKTYAFVAGLLFAIHPVHTERVANMTGGFDLLGVLFLFLAFYSYILFRKNNSDKAFVFSITFFILGLFSSEEAIIFPILVIAYDLCFVWPKSWLKHYLPIVLVSGGYLSLRYLVLGQIGRTDVFFMGDTLTRVLSTAVIFARYIFITLFPFWLSVDYNVTAYTSLGFTAAACLALLAFVCFACIKCYKSHRLAFFSICWFFIALIPFSNIFPVQTFMADRYLYVASLGFVLLLSYLISRLNHRKAAFAVVLVLVALYLPATILRNAEWKSDYALLSSAVERQPKSSIAHNDLGQVYQTLGDFGKAAEEYIIALRLNDRNHVAWLNLGTVYGEAGNYSMAEYYLNKSLSIYRSYKGHNNLGLIYWKMGKIDKAILELGMAIELEPSLSKAYMDLGVIYANDGSINLALAQFERAISLNPAVPDSHYNLAVLYEYLNKTDEAHKEYTFAYQLEPGNKLYKDKAIGGYR